VFPLAILFIAGPASIMAVVLMTDNNVYSVRQEVETAALLASCSASPWLPCRRRFRAAASRRPVQFVSRIRAGLGGARVAINASGFHDILPLVRLEAAIKT